MWLWPKKLTLEGKFKLFIYLGILIFLLNIPVIYLEIQGLNRSLTNLELVEDLRENILEIRRYEKNYFLYRDQESLLLTKYHYIQAKNLISKIIKQVSEKTFIAKINDLLDVLKLYKAKMKFDQFLGGKFPDTKTEKAIRVTGKKLVDTTEVLLREERRTIAATAQNALQWSLFFMVAMFLLFLMGAHIITTKVIKPLAMIEKATEKVARGDFSPIPQPKKNESQVDHLIIAFNRMAQELEAREEQIIHSRKIASLGTLVSGIAHELNNPINNIVITADVLNGRKNISEDRRSALINDILQQALRASEIVKNLLEFSRAETSGYKEIDLASALRETLQVAENHIVLSNVRLNLDIDDDLPKIMGNRQGLQQVFLNLITNAVQAMEDGGDLTIRATVEDDDKLRVEVQDTGTGIPEKDLPHIFDPFFTTKEVGKGTGLGLSVSFGIIKKHGGKISVKSKVGEGTTFTILLPACKKNRNA